MPAQEQEEADQDDGCAEEGLEVGSFCEYQPGQERREDRLCRDENDRYGREREPTPYLIPYQTSAPDSLHS